MWLDHLLSRENAVAGVKSEKTCRSARLWKTEHYDGAVAIYDCTGAIRQIINRHSKVEIGEADIVQSLNFDISGDWNYRVSFQYYSVTNV